MLLEYILSYIRFVSISSGILFSESGISWLFVQAFITDETPLPVYILSLEFINLIYCVGSLQSPWKTFANGYFHICEGAQPGKPYIYLEITKHVIFL